MQDDRDIPQADLRNYGYWKKYLGYVFSNIRHTQIGVDKMYTPDRSRTAELFLEIYSHPPPRIGGDFYFSEVGCEIQVVQLPYQESQEKHPEYVSGGRHLHQNSEYPFGEGNY